MKNRHIGILFFVKIHSRCNTFVVSMELLSWFWSARVCDKLEILIKQCDDSFKKTNATSVHHYYYYMCRRQWAHRARNRTQCEQSRDERVSLTRFFAVCFIFFLVIYYYYYYCVCECLLCFHVCLCFYCPFNCLSLKVFLCIKKINSRVALLIYVEIKFHLAFSNVSARVHTYALFLFLSLSHQVCSQTALLYFIYLFVCNFCRSVFAFQFLIQMQWFAQNVLVQCNFVPVSTQANRQKQNRHSCHHSHYPRLSLLLFLFSCMRSHTLAEVAAEIVTAAAIIQRPEK